MLTILCVLLTASLFGFGGVLLREDIEAVLSDYRDATFEERLFVAILLPTILATGIAIVIVEGLDSPTSEDARETCRSAVNVILRGSAE